MHSNQSRPKIYKYKYFLVACVLLVAALLSLFFRSSEAEIPMGISKLEAEVLALRKVNRKADIDVSALVERHIEIGMDRRNLLLFLSTINDLEITIEQSLEAETVVASKFLLEGNRFTSAFGFRDELRIVVVLKNKKILNVKGRIFYHSI